MAIGTLGISAIYFPYIGVIGLGIEDTPTVILYVEVNNNNNNTIILKHNGGDELQWNDLKVLVDGKEIGSNDYGYGFFTVGNEHIIKKNCVSDKSYTVKVIFIPSDTILLEKDIYVK